MTNNAQNNSFATHHEISKLLPWYVNQSLKGAELSAVEKHLSACLMCKRELIQLQKLSQAVVNDHSFDTAEKASFSRLKNRLHAGQPILATQNSEVQSKRSEAIDIKRFKPKSINSRIKQAFSQPAWAMAAAGLLALLFPLKELTNGNLAPVNIYQTLSDGQAEKLNANEIRVVFAEQVSDKQKDLILQKIHGQFLENPTAQGVYTIQLEHNIAPRQLLDIVGLLQKDKDVVFAEPAYAFLSSVHEEEHK